MVRPLSLASPILFLAAFLAQHESLKNGYYDYIVVGGGPAGIIAAEKFIEAGNKVLLLERGVGPTVATGANETLMWNKHLTPIDLPGLSADVGNLDLWNEYLCSDTVGYAACVLGGGVTVNYMVFVHPPAHDFDDNNNWPVGWKWRDLKPAADRLYKRNPGTILPSADGKRYDQNLYNVLSNFFNRLGWKSVDMITQPDEKHQVYSYPAWNIKDQKRGGPVRTYLPEAKKSKNFDLNLGANVIRVVRSGSQVTGVEVQLASGKTEIVSLADKGRVVLAAGALSSPRILFNSGIGPKKQIETAKKSGVTVPAEKEWLELPVGVGLRDHPIFSIYVETGGDYGVPDYDAIIDGSDTTDINLYKNGTGLLTQGKHRLLCPNAGSVLDITTYLTHGSTSQGVLGLDVNQNTVFERSPYMQTADGRRAARSFIQQLVNNIQGPATGFKLKTNLNTTAILASQSPGMHYTGTAKMGTDNGLKNGTSVVDVNTKVYGMDNLYVIDGSIHPDLPTGNIQATITIIAEAAAARILAQD
ncbi:FAD/NAD(P)-binding domain-containing protein [Penicillium maclennaniae]|uniref:FAD/NAD(P)-binding domain-containing protein n=1 Tax=Penicillium maclennaniae TaxID=1343394 RepID=UPI0025410526|nr:FAD/NAD(P)-binding domain-containing protein [Penicillium maclennaniae]KAJ5665380.1 FAD/NAD(P)-binding domain-containing protein [Penicillium maclennaniae]